MPPPTSAAAYNKSLEHRVFRAGIALKGLDGVLEIVAGIFIWFVTPAFMAHVFGVLYGHEFFRDAHPAMTAHLMNASQQIAGSHRLFSSVFLLSHGITKIILVVALWMERLWAYPLVIIVFGAFCVYQIYRFIHTYSPVMVILTVFDIAVIYLAWRDYRALQSVQRSNAR
jgi:uncharacterized membrane protein